MWNVSFIMESTLKNHLWQYFKLKCNAGVALLSFTWYRRNEEDVRTIGVYLIKILGEIKSK